MAICEHTSLLPARSLFGRVGCVVALTMVMLLGISVTKGAATVPATQNTSTIRQHIAEWSDRRAAKYAPLDLIAHPEPATSVDPGEDIGLRATLQNPTRNKVVGSWSTPACSQFYYLAVRNETGTAVSGTRMRRWWDGLPIPGRASSRQLSIPGGARFTYPLQVPVSRYFDVTVPGVYKIRLGMSAHHVLSKWIKVRVVTPQPPKDGAYLGPPSPLKSFHKVHTSWGPLWHGICMKLSPRWSKAGPKLTVDAQGARFDIELANTSDKPISISLCGLPLCDFGPITILGPQRIALKWRNNTKHNLRNKPVPLTAYGQVLASQHPKTLPSKKTFTLKPHSVYRYRGVLRPGAVRDMSLAGTYRLQVGLSGTGCHSKWIRLTIPPTE